MADHPILFSAPMVRALLAGTKTQTRRAIKPQPTEWQAQVIDITKPIFDEDQGGWGQWETEWSSPSLDMPMGQPEREIWRPLRGLRYGVGDRLWVRENVYGDENPWSGQQGVRYVADNHVDTSRDGTQELFKLRHYRRGTGLLVPSIHMPRWASRLTLIVTDVRVQRLQDISEEDARAEGVICLGRMDGEPWDHCYVPGVTRGYEAEATTCYSLLWEEINGEGSWAANPWVVAYTFTVHQQNIDAMEAANG